MLLTPLVAHAQAPAAPDAAARRRAGHLQPGHRAAAARALRPVPSSRRRRAVQPRDLRRRQPARRTARGGDGERLHAAVEGRRTPGRVRGPAAPHRATTSPASAAGPRRRSKGPGSAPVPPRWPDGWYLGEPDLIVTLPAGYTLPGEPSDVFRIFAVPLPVTGTALRARHRVPSRQRPRRPPRQHPHRSQRRLPPPRRRRRRARLRRPAGPVGRVSRRPFPGLDAGADRAAGRRRSGLASRSRHRPGRAAPHAAERQARSRAPVDRLLLQRSAADPHAVDPPPRIAGDRHPAPARAATWSRTATRCRWTRRCSPCSPTRTTGPPTSPARPRSPTARAARSSTSAAGTSAGSTSTATPIRCGCRAAPRWRCATSTTTRPQNPRNPQLPPARVRWGQRSFDEMGDLWFQLATDSDADRTRLRAEVQAKMTAEDLIGLETMLAVGPRRHRAARRRRRAGAAARAPGRGGEPFPRHARSADRRRRRPTTTSGTALTSAGLFDDAIASLRAGAAHRPGLRQGAQQPGRHA